MPHSPRLCQRPCHPAKTSTCSCAYALSSKASLCSLDAVKFGCCRTSSRAGARRSRSQRCSTPRRSPKPLTSRTRASRTARSATSSSQRPTQASLSRACALVRSTPRTWECGFPRAPGWLRRGAFRIAAAVVRLTVPPPRARVRRPLHVAAVRAGARRAIALCDRLVLPALVTRRPHSFLEFPVIQPDSNQRARLGRAP